MTTTIESYMTPSPHTIGRDQTLKHAHEIMREHKIRHLPVLHGGKLLGIVSSRDLYFIESEPDVNPTSETVEEAMTPDPYVVLKSASLTSVASHMAEHHLGCALVTDDHGKMLGIFTTVDALRALAHFAK
ncbi:MAG: CBS domain-containing protein [Deltaproteobacteria bacterium]|nr:CBS domain-containing protein [Deltaproteobacteria bacterium]